MATLSSIPTNITPLLPCNFDFIEDQKPLGFVDSSSSSPAPFPNLVFVPLPCRSALQSKRGIEKRSNGKKRETIETIVASCISRAVAFSGHQFKVILKSFQDLSARKNTCFGDVRCNNAGQKHPNGPIDNNGNGDGDGAGGGGGGGSGSGSHGEGKSSDGSSSLTLMGPVWRRAQKASSIARGRTVLLRSANRAQNYDYATGGTRAWQWAAEGIAARVLMDPAVVEAMFQGILFPFQVLLLLLSPEFANQIAQCVMTAFVVAPVVAIVILWLIWRWWMEKNAQGIDVEDDDDGDGDKE